MIKTWTVTRESDQREAFIQALDENEAAYRAIGAWMYEEALTGDLTVTVKRRDGTGEPARFRAHQVDLFLEWL